MILWLAMLLVGGPRTGWDPALLAAMHVSNGSQLAAFARVLTEFGGVAVLAPAAVAAALALLVTRRAKLAIMLLVIVFGGRLLVELQKLGFDRARPDPAGRLVAVHSMSFPSGHAANSMITWLSLAIVAGGAWARPNIAKRLAMAAFLFSLVIGLTRPVLGVHWPSDVVGGWAFGLAWTLGMLALLAPRSRPTTKVRNSDVPE